MEVIILLLLLQVSQPLHSFVMEVLDRVAVVDVIRLLLVFWYGGVDDTCHIFFISVLR